GRISSGIDSVKLARIIHGHLLRQPILSPGAAFLVRPPRRTTVGTPASFSLARSHGGLRSTQPRYGIHGCPGLVEKPVLLRYNACLMAIPAKDFVSLLQDVGFDFFTGVPDSTLGGIIATLIERRGYVPAVRGDEAGGLAAGGRMGGKIPAVLMQNSGLGTSLNALISLNLIYLQPCLLLVSWRGHDGKDAPEHLVMGQVMTKLLDLVRIPHRTL